LIQLKAILTQESPASAVCHSLIGWSVLTIRYLPVALLFLSMLVASPAQAFDCSKASTATEKLICSDSKLKQADDDLGQAWSKAQRQVSESEFKLLRLSQRAWLKSRDERCGHGSDAERIECLTSQTSERTAIIAAKAKFGPGSGAAMVPFARGQAGSRMAYKIELAGVRFARPVKAGEVSFNQAVDVLIKQAPFTEKIAFETAGQLSYDQSISLEFAAPNLVSALVRTWRYDGGAHGNTVFSAINISPEAGDPTFDMLFSDAAQVDLTDACQNQLYRMEDDKFLSEAELQEMLFPEYGEAIAAAVKNLSAWTFSSQGARVIFSPYELAPFAAGSFECRLPLALLRNMSLAAQFLPR